MFVNLITLNYRKTVNDRTLRVEGFSHAQTHSYKNIILYAW